VSGFLGRRLVPVYDMPVYLPLSCGTRFASL